MKMKKNGLKGGTGVAHPLDPSLNLVASLFNVYLFVTSTVVHSPFKSLWITSDQTSYILTGWSKGALGTRAPRSNFFHFHAVFGKNLII